MDDNDTTKNIMSHVSVLNVFIHRVILPKLSQIQNYQKTENERVYWLLTVIQQVVELCNKHFYQDYKQTPDLGIEIDNVAL